MANATDYLEDELLKHIFSNHISGNPTYTPGTLEIGLFTSMPDPETPSGQAECVYTNYARVTLSGTQFNTPFLNTAGKTVIDNATAIIFPTAGSPASETATHFMIFETDTANQPIVWGILAGGGLAISNGIQPRFEPGDFIIEAA